MLLHVYCSWYTVQQQLVRPPGLEPGQPHGRQILSLLCLPIPPWARLACPEGLEPPTHSLEGCCSNPAELRADKITNSLPYVALTNA